MKGILSQSDEKTVLIHQINTLRKEHKGNWYYFNGVYKDKSVVVKGYGTWLQVFRIDGVDYSNCMDGSAKAFVSHLEESFNRAV